MDFDRGGELAMLLDDCMVELNLYACDLDFRSSVKYTYERDDCLTHSWLDHYVLVTYLILFPTYTLFILD